MEGDYITPVITGHNLLIYLHLSRHDITPSPEPTRPSYLTPLKRERGEAKSGENVVLREEVLNEEGIKECSAEQRKKEQCRR